LNCTRKTFLSNLPTLVFGTLISKRAENLGLFFELAKISVHPHPPDFLFIIDNDQGSILPGIHIKKQAWRLGCFCEGGVTIGRV
jgi:hypothetical protein